MARVRSAPATPARAIAVRSVSQPDEAKTHATLHSCRTPDGDQTRCEALKKDCGLAARMLLPARERVGETEFIEAPECDGGDRNVDEDETPVRKNVRGARLKPVRRAAEKGGERQRRRQGGRSSDRTEALGAEVG